MPTRRSNWTDANGRRGLFLPRRIFSGTPGLPRRPLCRLNKCRRRPDLTSHAPRSCKHGCQFRYWHRSSATCAGQENMSGIAAIHDALRQIDSRTGYVRCLVYIRDSVDRTAVFSIRSRIFGCSCKALLISRAHRAGSSGLWKKASAIPSPVGTRISCPRFRGAKAFRISHDLLQRLQQFNLLVHEQL